ncbi:biotin/lipoyl-containing protein [Aquimarina hainanensis]|uniref:Biotin/lipoyl-containing protein n=1 Tax=Aquimarina hainanensis TaxID=1578017 RepID=A0ABW5NG80_9FLAO|nr:acetyl-CoA carboxylase biotin carboxyl carrier protein subunit [Aquimarina sp. TRL1]QKX07273.1 biotin attachment protein [Aquimarina sp. TRL1]
MSNTFKLKVNNAFDIELTEESLANLDAVKTTPSKYHILHHQKPYEAEIISSDFDQKNYVVNINNNTYTVDIANALDQLIAEMGFSIGSSKQINQIKAPMPGLIIDVHVNEGQEVKEEEYLLVLEAMKMENIITSPRDGIIKSVSITSGETVDKGKLLIEFE